MKFISMMLVALATTETCAISTHAAENASCQKAVLTDDERTKLDTALKFTYTDLKTEGNVGTVVDTIFTVYDTTKDSFLGRDEVDAFVTAILLSAKEKAFTPE